MKKISYFLLHSNRENLKVNKKAFAESLIEKILWIIVLIVLIYGVIKLINYWTGM